MNTSKRLFHCFGRASLIGLFLVLAACSEPRYAPPAPGESRTVVVWISIDGVRPDYLARGELPFFDMLARDGAASGALAPIFPSLTFPNHVSQATGVTVDRHGVPLNSFYDTERDREYFYPGFPSLLQAEPIWTTAQRQGRRVAVYDWVLSHRQEDEHAASYFGDRYDSDLTDRERLQIVLDTWRKDRDEQPLQLLMGYMVTPDKIGHEFGPDAPEVESAMKKMDEHLSWFMRQALRIFNRRMDPEHDELYLIITSDHGMSTVHTVVNPREMTGITRMEDREDDIVLMTTGNLAHIFLNKIEDETERAKRKSLILDSLAQHDFADVYTRDTLPERWGYAHPTRVGDVVVKLHTGYSFSRRVRGLTASPAEADAPVGMHGYDVEDNPEMNGIALIWRYPNPLGGIELGPTHSLQLHATVAHLLGIEPADGARTDAIALE